MTVLGFPMSVNTLVCGTLPDDVGTHLRRSEYFLRRVHNKLREIQLAILIYEVRPDGRGVALFHGNGGGE